MDERDRRHRREFEPPPWEQEAFERFKKEREEQEAEAELEAALRVVRQPVVEPEDEGVPDDAEAPEPAAVDPKTGEAEAADGEDNPGGVSPAELETMLIGLKGQEPTTVKSYRSIANTVCALLVVGGLGFVVWAAVLFAKVGGNSAGPTPVLASLLLMSWGFLLIGGAALLFRKYNM